MISHHGRSSVFVAWNIQCEKCLAAQILPYYRMLSEPCIFCSQHGLQTIATFFQLCLCILLSHCFHFTSLPSDFLIKTSRPIFEVLGVHQSLLKIALRVPCWLPCCAFPRTSDRITSSPEYKINLVKLHILYQSCILP